MLNNLHLIDHWQFSGHKIRITRFSKQFNIIWHSIIHVILLQLINLKKKLE